MNELREKIKRKIDALDEEKLKEIASIFGIPVSKGDEKVTFTFDVSEDPRKHKVWVAELYPNRPDFEELFFFFPHDTEKSRNHIRKWGKVTLSKRDAFFEIHPGGSWKNSYEYCVYYDASENKLFDCTDSRINIKQYLLGLKDKEDLGIKEIDPEHLDIQIVSPSNE